MENGITLVMAVIYVSPNQKMQDIQEFIHKVLLEYTEEGSRVLQRYNKDYSKLPLILAGDFNVNFADKQSEPLTQFLGEEFNLKMNNDPTISTTKYNTSIDAVFSRYLDKIESKTFVSYFSYHKTLISVIE
uniref:Endonuclease/exonuclease/phosphatase domain-containing protein n=1 Tax=Bactrocera latifrons TaxID=174628 RepID=A0A0K8WEQ5_BACLA